MNKQYTDSIMKLGGPKRKKNKNKNKKNLASKVYGFSTICKYVSFSKTTIHQALPISVSPLSKMWLVFYLESIPDSCDSCQQTRKEATTELLSN